MTSIKILLYFIALMLVLVISWAIQDIHLGWGYTLGILGVLTAYFVAVNAIAKKTNK
jgi:uncharacterized membrane protein YccC